MIDSIVPAARGNAPNAVSPPPTRDTAAYDLYLLGRAAQEARPPSACANRSPTSSARCDSIRSTPRPTRDSALADALAELAPAAHRAAGRAETRRSAPYRALSTTHRGITKALRHGARERIPRAPRSCTSGAGAEPNNVAALWDYTTTLNDAWATRGPGSVDGARPKVDPRPRNRVVQVIGNPSGMGVQEPHRTSTPWPPWPTIQTGSISSREPHVTMAGRQKRIAQHSQSSRPET